MLAFLAVFSSQAFAASKAELDSMSARCEAAREQKLIPVREQKTRSCIEQKIRAPDHCQRYYTTYGNTSIVGGMRRQGMFYDLPECQSFLDAQAASQAGRSRNP
ncbi:MAG: hypothetical protein V7754_19740 [Halioglobus sp.]